MLIETRAKGGNLLLNVGPHPDGYIPLEQEKRLRELALWNFVNGEAIFNTRPWHVSNEGNIWLTRSKDSQTVYAIPTGEAWVFGKKKTITLRSIKASGQTEIEILGQTGRILEYKPDIVPKATWQQDADGLHITATRAQRLYTNYQWPNPIVIKITNARPAE
jgi:alpha-L-fucosidase